MSAKRRNVKARNAGRRSAKKKRKPPVARKRVAKTNVRAVVDWLARGARTGLRSEDVLGELCRRLVVCGMPLWRVSVFVMTLHPGVMGRAFRWQARSAVAVSEGSYEMMETAAFKSSPFAVVHETGKMLRRRLTGRGRADDFAVLRDLRAEGGTDYVALPLTFTDGAIHVAAYATRQRGGFTAAQFSGLQAITPALARVAEIRALRRTASNLLDTYVGHQTGERILAGKIRLGQLETIRAAIWLSDMRGFTTASERLSPQALIDRLNRYFGAQVPAIHEHDGEVLKFMGDGLLAIFPIAGDCDAGAVCRRALDCALDVRERIAKLPREAGGDEPIRFGLALHAGEVMYGNIGGGNRLDFTCIGPAVNLAARLEKVASKLGATVVASREFAGRVEDKFVSLGEFAVAGFATPQTVFGLAEEGQ